MFISVDIFASEVKNKDIHYYMVIIQRRYMIKKKKLRGKFSKSVHLLHAEGCSSKDGTPVVYF